MQDPIFETALENKLSHTGIRKGVIKTVRDVVLNYMQRHPDQAKIIIGKVELSKGAKKTKCKDKGIANTVE